MNGGSNLLYMLKDSLRSLRENLATTIFTAVTLGFSLSIFTLFLFVFSNLNAAVSNWGDRTQVIAYIKDSASVDKLKESVEKIQGVKSVEFVSKEKALKELKDGLKGHETVLEGVDTNPLPASFEIKIGDYKNPAQVNAVVEQLKQMDWVEEVQYSREWVEKVSAFLKFVELAALMIGVFLAAATIFIISNTIRLAVYARKDEIEILRLVGASDSFIKIPFFVEGVAQGFLGGAIALFILGAGRYILLSKIPPYFAFAAVFPIPAPLLFVILVFAGILMGVVGTFISMGKFLKV